MEYSTVSITASGLVSPQIAEYIGRVRQEVTPGPKIVGNYNVYWYLVRPGSSLDITPYGEQVVIDIDTGLLTNKIIQYPRCTGSKGSDGNPGSDGNDGTPGPNEDMYPATIEGGKLTIERTVPTPLDTPISLRLYQNNVKVAEIIIADSISFISNTIGIDTNSPITFSNGTLRAELGKPGGITGQLYYKVRQVGPTGDAGNDGQAFIGVINTTITDPAVRHDRPIRIIRRNIRNDVVYIAAQLDGELPTTSVRKNGDYSFIVSLSSLTSTADIPKMEAFVAVEPVSSARSIYRWGFIDQLQLSEMTLTNLGDLSITDLGLSLPNWTPFKLIGYGGWTGFQGASDIQCCQEDLFVCTSLIQTVC